MYTKMHYMQADFHTEQHMNAYMLRCTLTHMLVDEGWWLYNVRTAEIIL